MRLQIILVLSVILVCNGIKVPIDRSEENVEEEAPTNGPIQVAPTYYVNDEDVNSEDSYLRPPNPQQEPVDDNPTPATYLLPPAPGKQPEVYYNPTQSEQSDWYPITQDAPPQAPLNNYQIFNQTDIAPQEHTRRSKSHESSVVPVPATGLEPPRIDAPNEYFLPPSAEELPLQEVQRPVILPRIVSTEETRRPINLAKPIRYKVPIIVPNKELPLNYRPKPIEVSLPLHLIPPLPENYKVPTKLYPKKYGGEFKPVPLPLAQYLDDSALEIPRAKPAKLFKPLPSSETDYLTPTDEKINYLYRKAEHKRKLKGEELSQVQPTGILPQSTYSYKKYNEQPAEVLPQPTYSYQKYKEQPTEVLPQPTYSYKKYNEPLSEQQPSESNHRHPGRNAYPAPLRQASPPGPQHDSAAPAPDGRTEFRMHGMKGPHSYQFGFDTGKGKNRQFRYEERDNDGKVQGHYGYMDKHGKLRVVNYSADPKTGFQADAPVDKE